MSKDTKITKEDIQGIKDSLHEILGGRKFAGKEITDMEHFTLDQIMGLAMYATEMTDELEKALKRIKLLEDNCMIK